MFNMMLSHIEILCTFLFFVSLFFAYFCIKFALIILRFQESTEECLEIIDDKYLKIVKILEIPLFFDSPEIKKLLSELKDIKMSIVHIANKLSLNDIRLEEEKNEDKN